MAGIGILLAWAGYSVFYYGYNTVTGGNESLASLIWPGSYQSVPRDGQGSSSSGGSKSSSSKGKPSLKCMLFCNPITSSINPLCKNCGSF